MLYLLLHFQSFISSANFILLYPIAINISSNVFNNDLQAIGINFSSVIFS